MGRNGLHGLHYGAQLGTMQTMKPITENVDAAIGAFGQRLRGRRLAMGISQEVLSGRIGVSLPTLRAMEMGRQNVAIGHVFAALEAMDRLSDVDHLLACEAHGPGVRKRAPSRRRNSGVHDEGVREMNASCTDKRFRPTSIRDAVRAGEEFGDPDSFVREFLDEFYLATDAAMRGRMIEEEPPLVADGRANAYVAAVAEHLAMRWHLPIPAWTGSRERFLRRAYFPAGLESLKATLITESPAAFRRRMIFVEMDPLYRPRREMAGMT